MERKNPNHERSTTADKPHRFPPAQVKAVETETATSMDVQYDPATDRFSSKLVRERIVAGKK